MDIAHLKTFLEIYRLRHFGKASERLYITQSAASARIKLLEERLGIKLFERKHMNVTPTAAGERLVKYAEAVVTNWEQARLDVGLPENVKRSLTISAVPDIWHFVVNTPLTTYFQAQSSTAFHVSLHHTEVIIERLLAGNLDIGLVFEPIQLAPLESIALCPFNLTLLSTQPNQSLTTMNKTDYIMVDWGPSFSVELAQTVPELNTAAIHVNSGLVALDILRNQSGSAYLPQQCQTHVLSIPHLPNLYAIAETAIIVRHLYILYRHKHVDVDHIENMVNTLQQMLLPTSPEQ